MCDCAISWVEDTSVEGAHSQQKVSCADYISQLERTVQALDPSGMRLAIVKHNNGVTTPPPQI